MTDQHHLISDSTKLEVTRTSRGFAIARGVDRYAAPYSIQDSSLAEEAAIWLGSDADTGGRAHLTQDMAAGLIPLLQAFVATGSIASSADTIAAPPAMDRHPGWTTEGHKWLDAGAPMTPAMDREAVEKLVEPWADYHGDLPDYDHPLRPVYESGIQYAVELLAKELGVTDWTPCDGTEEFDGDLGGTLTNIILEAMPKDKDGDPIHPRDLLSTLSADAIRQGEGWQSIETAPRDGTWFIADGGGLERPTPMKWCERVGAWEADAVMLEDWDQQAEGYSRPLFWFALPDRPATPASHASGATATNKES